MQEEPSVYQYQSCAAAAVVVCAMLKAVAVQEEVVQEVGPAVPLFPSAVPPLQQQDQRKSSPLVALHASVPNALCPSLGTPLSDSHCEIVWHH